MAKTKRSKQANDVPEVKPFFTGPAYELVQLPSRGLTYPEEWTDDEGRISMRPMTVKEEKIMATTRLAKQGKSIDMILKNCIENDDIDTLELLSGDRSFLLYHLRCISYGAYYEFRLKCPNCSANINSNIDLNELETIYLPDEFEEPIEFKLPISKHTVYYRLSRGKDEIAVLKERQRRASSYGADQIDNSLTERYLLQVTKIDDVEDRSQIRNFIESMMAGDSAALREDMERSACGIDTTIYESCPSCGADIETEVPLSEGFFRYSAGGRDK